MKVAVISEGDSLSSYIADDFGHAPYVLIVNTDTMTFEAVKNEFISAEGAGMKMAAMLISSGADIVITGGIGPHGYNMLTEEGITVSFDEDGIIEDRIKAVIERLERMKKYE